MGEFRDRYDESKKRIAAILGLDPKAFEIYAFAIHTKMDRDGNSPSYKEIMEACKVSSTSEVQRHLRNLAKAGLIRASEDGRSRGIEIAGGQWNISAEIAEAMRLIATGEAGNGK